MFGISGTSVESPRSQSRTIGAHPDACVPYTRGVVPSTSPASTNSLNPLPSFVTSEPPAIGATIALGSRQPSCSTISYAIVFEPSP